MILKTCRICLIVRPLSEFFRQPMMADGHRSDCKSCRHDYDVKNRDRFRDRNRARARKHGLREEIKTKRCEYYQARKNDPEFKARLSEIGKKGYKKFEVKRLARVVIRKVTRSGVLIPETECSQCQSTRYVEGHHEDYTKPLDIMWLCRECHGTRHQEINDLIRSGEDWTARGFA